MSRASERAAREDLARKVFVGEKGAAAEYEVSTFEITKKGARPHSEWNGNHKDRGGHVIADSLKTLFGKKR